MAKALEGDDRSAHLCTLTQSLALSDCTQPHSRGTGRATGSRRVQTRASRAWRMAAQSLRTSPRYLGALFRRMRRKLGPAKATTATAHTLAKMIYHRLKEQTPSRERSAAD